MKKNLLLLVLLVSQNVFSQSAKQVLEVEIVKLLQADGILFSTEQRACSGKCRPLSPWNNEQQKERQLKKDDRLKTILLRKFSPPTFCEQKQVTPALTFRDRSVGKIGSYLIRNDNLEVLRTDTEPILPILSTGNQVSVPNPLNDGSNYSLNFISTKLFRQHSDLNLEGDFKEYFNTKMQASINLSNQDRTQISIGAGTFENQLGVLFRKTVNGETSALNFSSIYYLWNAYKNNQIRQGDKIIFSFKGMCFYSSKGVESNSDFEFNSELNSKGKFPFLSYGLAASAKWTNSSQLTTQTSIYNVFMFEPPVLIDIPTLEQVNTVWGNLSQISNAVSFPSTPTIPTNSPLILKVTFGPVPYADIIPLIKLDEQYSLSGATGTKFIQRVNLITDPGRIKDNENGYYTFDVEVFRDENFISSHHESLDDIVECEFPIRIFIDNPIQGRYLEKVYQNIKVFTERYPTAYSSQYEVIATKDDPSRSYLYKTFIRFNAPQINISSSPRPPIVTDVFGLPASVDQDLKKVIQTSTIRPLANNEFELKFSTPYSSRYFNYNQRSYDVALLVQFSANSRTYSRKVPVRIVGHDEQIVATSNITTGILIRENNELLETLNPAAKLKDGRTVSDLMASFSSQGRLDVLGFISEFKKQSDLTLTPDNNYSINASYLDLKKLK